MPTPKLKRRADGTVLVQRFTRIRRYEHTLVIVTFTMLLLTGLPQKFESSWSAGLIHLVGGLHTIRLLHHIAGVVFVLHAVAHLSTIVIGVLAGKMNLSLLPGPQDLWDAWNNLNYYLGFRNRPAALDTFDYREKFEYMGLILGGLVMGFTGLVLLFPALTASLTSGMVIPPSMVAHSNEAMLAMLVLIIWHTYGAVLSPEVFPLDTSIFTGYQTVADFKHHHALAYHRAFPDGLPPEFADGEPKGH